VPIDLEAFRSRIRDHAAQWDELQLEWSVSASEGYPSKPSTFATFDGAGRISQVVVWVTGELDVDTIRVEDGLVVNTHYDLESIADLDTALDELLALLRRGKIPRDAFVAQA
jgi:hypothetical protein